PGWKTALPEIGESVGLWSCDEVLKNDPSAPGEEMTTGRAAKSAPVVIFPILFVPLSTNQRSPSGRPTMPVGALPAPDGIAHSVTGPVGVRLPILPLSSVNQMFPSEPPVIPSPPEGTGNSAITPEVVARPTLPAFFSMNHRYPPGPDVMPNGPAPAVGIG